MRRNGYESYHGRSRGRTALKVLIGVLLVLLVLSVAALFFLEPYIHYSADGVRVELPFFGGGQTEPDSPAVTVPIQVATPSPTPAPTPEPKTDYRGVLLPVSALSDGTAVTQAEAAGATTVLFQMKSIDGTLAFETQSALGTARDADGANEAIAQFTAGDVETGAYLSCFRDNALPRTDRSLSVHSSGGNWWDDEVVRWCSPMSERMRSYVTDLCRELVALGFDELVLDNCAFPNRGNTSAILSDDNYDPAALTETMETFFRELDAALGEYPDVKVSVVTSLTVLTGGSDGSGLTLDLLKQYADRVFVEVPEGENLPAIEGLEIVPIVTQGTDTGSWALLS